MLEIIKIKRLLSKKIHSRLTPEKLEGLLN